MLTATLLAVIPFVWGLIWGSSVAIGVLVSVLFLVLAVEVLLGVWMLVTAIKAQGAADEARLEKVRSQVDWRVQYEAGTLFKSIKGLHQDNVIGWKKLSDHPQGGRRQGDRAVKALNSQAALLISQQEAIEGLRELVVELVARVDSAPDSSSADGKLISADQWLADRQDAARP